MFTEQMQKAFEIAEKQIKDALGQLSFRMENSIGSNNQNQQLIELLEMTEDMFGCDANMGIMRDPSSAQAWLVVTVAPSFKKDSNAKLIVQRVKWHEKVEKLFPKHEFRLSIVGAPNEN